MNLAAVLRRRSSLDEVTEEDWDLQHDVNLKAAFFLARAAGRAMVEAGQGGRIILFSSQGWWTGGFGGSVVYASTKGGVTSMCRGLARTFGPHGITVNCIAPGQVHTPMLMTGLAPEVYESMKAQTPLGYVAEPEEHGRTGRLPRVRSRPLHHGRHAQRVRRPLDVLTGRGLPVQRGSTLPSPIPRARGEDRRPKTTSASPTPRCVVTTRPASGRGVPSSSASPIVGGRIGVIVELAGIAVGEELVAFVDQEERRIPGDLGRAVRRVVDGDDEGVRRQPLVGHDLTHRPERGNGDDDVGIARRASGVGGHATWSMPRSPSADLREAGRRIRRLVEDDERTTREDVPDDLDVAVALDARADDRDAGRTVGSRTPTRGSPPRRRPRSVAR